jgi:hypothetical protein
MASLILKCKDIEKKNIEQTVVCVLYSLLLYPDTYQRRHERFAWVKNLYL